MARSNANAAQVDLFLWDQLEDARREVERTELARQAARKAHKRAPHGTRSDRYAKLLSAAEEALKASRELNRLMREAKHG